MKFIGYFLIGALLGAAAWHFLLPPLPRASVANARAVDAIDVDAPGLAAPTPAAQRDFFVRITDDENGKPIAGATLAAQGEDDGSIRAAPVATDGEGFALWRVAAGPGGEVRVRADGFAPVLFLAKAGRHGTRIDPLLVGLERAATLIGVAHDGNGGVVANAKIVLTFESRATLRPRVNFSRIVSTPERRTTTADADGRFVFDQLPPDVELELRLTRANASAECDVTELWLDPGERRDFTWTLRGHARIHGRVTAPGGEPVGGAWICVGQPPWPRCVETTTNAAGEYALDDAPAGDVLFRIESKSDRHATLSQPIRLAAGEDREWNVALPPAAPLIVRAADAAGKPVAPGQVRAWSAIAGRSFDDASGRAPQIRLDHVPLGDVVVRVDPMAPANTQGIGPGITQGMVAGAETAFHHDGERECVVTLPAGARASGRFVDARDGRTPVAATVTALRRGGESSTESPRSAYFTAAPSTFTVDGLEPGAYDLVASDDDGRVGLLAGIELGAGATRADLAILLAPAATLDIEAPAVALGEAGDHFVFQIRSGVTRVGVASVKANGRTHLLVPPGALTVELRSGRDLRATRDVTARAGEQTRVRF